MWKGNRVLWIIFCILWRWDLLWLCESSNLRVNGFR